MERDQEAVAASDVKTAPRSRRASGRMGSDECDRLTVAESLRREQVDERAGPTYDPPPSGSAHGQTARST